MSLREIWARMWRPGVDPSLELLAAAIEQHGAQEMAKQVSIGPAVGQWALVTAVSQFPTGAVGLYAAREGLSADTFRALVGP